MFTEKQQERAAVRRGDRLDSGCSYLRADLDAVWADLVNSGYAPSRTRDKITIESDCGPITFGVRRAQFHQWGLPREPDQKAMHILYDHYPHPITFLGEGSHILAGIELALLGGSLAAVAAKYLPHLFR